MQIVSKWKLNKKLNKFIFFFRLRTTERMQCNCRYSTTQQNNSHRTKSKLCVEWTMKALASFHRFLHTLFLHTTTCISRTHPFKRQTCWESAVVHVHILVWKATTSTTGNKNKIFCVACIAIAWVSYVLCSVANLICCWNHFGANGFSFFFSFLVFIPCSLFTLIRLC